MEEVFDCFNVDKRMIKGDDVHAIWMWIGGISMVFGLVANRNNIVLARLCSFFCQLGSWFGQ